MRTKLITDPELGFLCNFFIGSAMTKPSDPLKDFLIFLFKKQESAWSKRNPKNIPSYQALKTYNAIKDKWIPITLNEINALFKKAQQDFSEWGRVLYLPPLKKDDHFVPVLSLYCKWNETHSIAKLRIMLVCLGNHTDECQKPYGIGFRLETPETTNQTETPAGDAGIHDFHHAQLIKKFGKDNLDRSLQIDCPSWLPESQPSFPLPAKCPLSLLFCLIATLYGKKEYNKYRNEFRKRSDHSTVGEHLKELDKWIS